MHTETGKSREHELELRVYRCPKRREAMSLCPTSERPGTQQSSDSPSKNRKTEKTLALRLSVCFSHR